VVALTVDMMDMHAAKMIMATKGRMVMTIACTSMITTHVPRHVPTIHGVKVMSIANTMANIGASFGKPIMVTMGKNMASAATGKTNKHGCYKT
jgi:predicted GTPase